MNQDSIASNSDLAELLLFQDNFISLVHSQVYRTKQNRSESVLKFQINFISQVNQKFNRMLKQLTTELVDNKLSYQLSLRDCFQKLLQSDYLPLLRINRYELTKLSLFGFDIYIDPLQAVLQILSRLDAAKESIVEKKIQFEQHQNVENALQNSWENYILFADRWKLSLNIYILKEYLRIGGKSFLRKDRQILFTGINNLYNQLVPILIQQNSKGLLCQLADLNNNLYYFHQSFNYFQFYAIQFPLTVQNQPIYAFMKEVAEKCIRTNILTPLLFGLLRHRQSFIRFIDEADSPIWLPYLNTIISGIAINLKFRILEYQQILEIFQKAANKAGLFGQIRTDQVSGELQEGWRDAKQFFISAVKIGFNSGDVQTWKLIECQAIGPKVIGSLIDGMLLNPCANGQKLKLYLGNGQQKLQSELFELSEGKLDLKLIKSNGCKLDKTIKTQKQVCHVIRIANLIQRLNQHNQNCLYFLVSCLMNIQIHINSSFTQKLAETASQINQMLFSMASSNLTLIKQQLCRFHVKYAPTLQIQQIIQLYFNNYQPKKCLTSLIQILPLQSDRPSLLTLAVKIIGKYVPKPSSIQIKIKTFQKQLFVKNELINANYQTHCLISVLVDFIIKGKQSAHHLLKMIIHACPWISFSLLNLPINQNGQLLSFSSWLIANISRHPTLCFLIQQSKSFLLSEEGVDLIEELLYPNICDQIVKQINDRDDIQGIKAYSNLLLHLYIAYGEKGGNCKDLLLVFIYLLEKVDESQVLKQLTKSILLLGQLAFSQRLQIWLNFLFERKIEGKEDEQRIQRKQSMKNIKNSIYFISEIQNSKNTINQPLAYQPQQTVRSKIQSYQQTTPIDFDATLRNCSHLIGKTMTNTKTKIDASNVMQIEQIKNIKVPRIQVNVLKEIFRSKMEQPQQKEANTTIIDFIGLNLQNYLVFVDLAIQGKDIQYLSRCYYIKNFNTRIINLMALQSESKVHFIWEMTRRLSTQEKSKISQMFLLQSSILPLYIEQTMGLQFLAVLNNANWRILMEYFSKEFSNSKLPSTLLQYSEYLTITNQKNIEYEQIITKFSSIFQKFVNFFILKFDSIFTLSISKEQLDLKSSNQLSSLNLLLSSLQFKEIMSKLGLLHRNMAEREIATNHSWIDSTCKLNDCINNWYAGDVLIPDFIYSFCLTNDIVYDRNKAEVGVLLQKYYQNLGQSLNKSKFYVGKKSSPISLSEMKEKDINEIEQFKILASSESYERTKKNYEDLVIELMSLGLISFQDNIIGLIYEQTNNGDIELADFYILGCLHALLQQKDRYQFDIFLSQIFQRQRLNWESFKVIFSQQYHYIKTILVEPEIAKKNINFVYEGIPLVNNAENIKVNDYNRENYCNRIALKGIGELNLKVASLLLKGFIHQMI